MLYDNSVTFNSVAGTLVKSCKESKIVRFHQDSPLAKEFFDLSNPHHVRGNKDIPVTVLQVMLCGDKQFLVEYLEV